MPTTASYGTGVFPGQPGAMQHHTPSDVSLAAAAAAAAPGVPAAVAARLQALLNRGEPGAFDSGTRQTPAEPTGAPQWVAEHVQDQHQQQQHPPGGNGNVAPQPPPAAAAGGGQLPAAPSDVLARLQQLKARQAAASPPPAHQAAAGAGALTKTQQSQGSTAPPLVAADLAGLPSCSQEDQQLQQPHDYVAALQRLLDRQQQQQHGAGAMQQQPQVPPAAAQSKPLCDPPGFGVEDMEEDYWGDGSRADPCPASSQPLQQQEAPAAGGEDVEGSHGVAAAAAAAAQGLASREPSRQQQLREEEVPGDADRVARDVTTPALTQRLLALAGRCLTAGDMSEAAQHARHAQQLAARPPQQRELAQMLALCHVLQHAEQQQWQQLLSEAPLVLRNKAAGADAGGSLPSSTPHAVAAGSSSSSLEQSRMQYRRLAALVHPDKCSHPAAEAAFKALQQALQQVQQQLSGVGLQAGQPPSDEDMQDDADASWWAEWDAEVAAEEQPHRPPTSEPREVDCQQDQELWGVPLPALQQEVAQRQRSVLQPRTAEEAALPAVARQKRLRVARSVLAVRLRQQQEAGAEGGLEEEEGGEPSWAQGMPAGGFLR